MYTTHSKTRRRKRTDTRVKELEQRVAEMSFLLEHGRSSSTPSSVEKEDDAADTQGLNSDIGGVFSFSNSSLSPGASTKDDSSAGPSNQQGLSQNFHLSGLGWEQNTKVPESLSILPDVIDRGILNMAKATELYQRYVDALLPQYPAVPLNCTVAELRSRKPILFLAVLAASSGASDPSLNRKLNKEIHSVYATKLAIQGLKSLELVQSLLVSILWTYPPDKNEDVKFHQQIHMAATMALDLGIAKKPKGNPMNQLSSKVLYAGQHPELAEDQESMRSSTRFPDGQPLDVSYEEGSANHVMSSKMHLPDSGSLESRRTLLACYLFCASVSMSLRLPNFLRYSSWMADCSEVLTKSPNAAPTDKRFVAWVQLQRLVEECGTYFALDSPDDTVSLADERTQLMLQSYEKQLEAWRQHAISHDNIMNPFLEITYHSNNIYLHEIALHPDHDVEDFKPPFSVAVDESKPHTPAGPLTLPYINAIIQCISSSDSLIETFLNMSAQEIRATPTLVYVRLVYAVVILIKISISTGTTELGKVIQPENIKVSLYLEKLLVHLKAVATLDSQDVHVLGAKFLQVLAKVKVWFQQQGMQHRTANEKAQSAATFEPSRSTIMKRENPSSYIDKSNFHTDFSKAPTMNTTMWPNQFQSSKGYFDPNYSVQPSWNDMAFDFPMDLDPNLFTNLMQADQAQSYQDSETSNVEAFNQMDYLNNMPDFGSWPMQ